jgi:hypothetical protein
MRDMSSEEQWIGSTLLFWTFDLPRSISKELKKSKGQGNVCCSRLNKKGNIVGI